MKKALTFVFLASFSFGVAVLNGVPISQGSELECHTIVETFKILPAGKFSPHVPLCSPIRYPTNPPTSGRHYGDWVQYKTYEIPIPQGFLVHNLEHGAIVISYNCPEGCEEELSELAAFIDASPTDPICEPEVQRRVVVVPDPSLDVRFAASAWGASLRSDCFDLEALGQFVQDFYGKGPEDTCMDGLDLEAPGMLPEECGLPGFFWKDLIQ